MWFEEEFTPDRPPVAQGPETDFFENFNAADASKVKSGISASRQWNLQEAYDGVLKEINKDRPFLKQFANPYAPAQAGQFYISPQRHLTKEDAETAIWTHIDVMRASDDTAFADLPRSRNDMVGGIAKQMLGAEKHHQQISDRADGWGTAGGIMGEMYATMKDPINLATLSTGAGAGATILRTAVIEGLINGGVELLTQPSIQDYREKMGLKRESIVENVALATGGGVVLGGGIKAITNGISKLSSKDLADLSKEVLKKPSKEQQAAIDMVEADNHAMDGTPFILGDIEGDLQHSSKLTETEDFLEQGKLPIFDDMELGSIPVYEKKLPIEQKIQLGTARLHKLIKRVQGKILGQASWGKEKKTSLFFLNDQQASIINKELAKFKVTTKGGKSIRDVSGYSVGAEDGELKHWFDNHINNPARETSFDNVQAEWRDLDYFTETVETGSVSYQGVTDGLKLPALKFEKIIDDNKVFVVTVRMKDRRLVFQTAYKKAIRKKAGAEAPIEYPVRSYDASEEQTLKLTSETSQTRNTHNNNLAQSDMVVTPRGTRVPVKYEVAELNSLITSHGDDLEVNPNFPKELQPRDRANVASAAQIQEIAGNLNPELLGKSATAGDGAPIVGADHIVDAGNGRTLALKKAYQGDDAKAYRQFLSNQGHDTSGFKQPVLIRRRLDDADMENRAAFARESNERSTMDMRTAERAAVDAANMKDEVLELYQGGDLGLARNRDFIRAFMETVAPSEHAGLVDGKGALSAEGLRRVKAAITAKAFEDADLLTRLLEVDHSLIKSISNVLMDVAPLWAKLRGSINRGEISPDMDVTDALLSAVKIVDRARTENRGVKEILDQVDLFEGEMPKQVERFLRMMFSDGGLKKAVSREKLTDTLENFIREAGKNKAGGGLFDDMAPLRATEIMDTVLDKHRNVLPPVTETNAKAATKAIDEFDELDGMDAEVSRILNEKGDLEIPEGDLDIETGSGRLSSLRTLMDDVDLDDMAVRETDLCVKGE